LAQGDPVNRRTFLSASLAGLGATALSPLIKLRRGSAATTGKRVILVGIGGGLRLRESLGMAEGAALPNPLGTAPPVSGCGTSAGRAADRARVCRPRARARAADAARDTALHAGHADHHPALRRRTARPPAGPRLLAVGVLQQAREPRRRAPAGADGVRAASP